MKKDDSLKFDNQTLEKILSVVKSHKKPYLILKKNYQLSQEQVNSFVKEHFGQEFYEKWRVKLKTKSRIKPNNIIEDDELNTKYYFNKKF